MSIGEAGRIAGLEERVEWMRSLNLFSNTFMSVALRDREACQYVLRTLLGKPDLVVRSVRTQYRVSRLVSKDSALDVLAEDQDGKLYNLEVQRADTVDHARRVRYYGSMIDSEFLEKGKKYSALPDVYLIYVSETDLWKYGLAAYPVQRCFQNLEHCEDGVKVLYANASERVHFLKREEGGYREMEDVLEKIFQEGVEEGVEQGLKEKERRLVFRMLARGDRLEDIVHITEAPPERIARLKQEWEAGER